MDPALPDASPAHDDDSLLADWAAAATPLPAPADEITRAGERLLARYDERHRAYHSRLHLAEALRALATLLPPPTPDGADPRAASRPAERADPLEASHPAEGADPQDASRPADAADPHDAGRAAAARLALWFHDAVYDPRAPAGENEAHSADLARRVLTDLDADPSLVAEVAALVTMTADHTGGTTATADAVHDADLWILASPTARFDHYCTQVRAEYAHVPADIYGPARSRILRDLIDRPDGLYRTPHARAEWDAPARQNVARELARLTP